MASTLTDRLSRLVKTMRGQARITESNVQDMLREVRMALLEAKNPRIQHRSPKYRKAKPRPYPHQPSKVKR